MVIGINKGHVIRLKGVTYMVCDFENTSNVYKLVALDSSEIGNFIYYEHDELLEEAEFAYNYQTLKTKVTDEMLKLYSSIDDKDEIIQSLHDEIEARNCYTQKVIAERNRLQEEINAMVDDHEKEMIVAEKELENVSFSTLNMFEINDTITDFMRADRGSCLTASETIMFFELAEKFAKRIDRKKK